jgi:hypothetical protein
MSKLNRNESGRVPRAVESPFPLACPSVVGSNCSCQSRSELRFGFLSSPDKGILLKALSRLSDQISVTDFAEHPQSAVIQIGASHPGGARRSEPCVFREMKGKRLIVELGEPLRSSQAVSVEYNDAMFLGEVSGCQEVASGDFEVEVSVEQILTGLQSLMLLRAHLLDAAVPRAFTRVPAGGRN